MVLPKGNIWWEDIKPQMKVKLITGATGQRFYLAGGKLVYWSGRDARRAQKWLDSRVKADARRK